jgi:hypothetical protein
LASKFSVVQSRVFSGKVSIGLRRENATKQTLLGLTETWNRPLRPVSFSAPAGHIQRPFIAFGNSCSQFPARPATPLEHRALHGKLPMIVINMSSHIALRGTRRIACFACIAIGPAFSEGSHEEDRHRGAGRKRFGTGHG